MSENKINIDDLIRQKLNTAEKNYDTQEPWSKMSQLLDDEMPEEVTPFYARKSNIFTVVTVLLFALGLGIYKLISNKHTIKSKSSISNQNNTISPNNTNTAPLNPNTQSTLPNNTLATQKAPLNPSTTQQNDNTTTRDNNSITKDDTKHPLNVTQKVDAKGASQIIKGNEKNTNQTPDATINPQEIATNESLKHSINDDVLHTDIANNSNKKEKSIKHFKANNNNNTLTNSSSANNNKVKSLEEVAKSNNSNITPNMSDNKLSLVQSNLNNDKVLKDNNAKPTNSLANSNPQQQKSTNKTTKEDSINTYTITSKEKLSKGFPRKSSLSYDTINNGKVALSADNNNSLTSTKPKKQNIALKDARQSNKINNNALQSSNTAKSENTSKKEVSHKKLFQSLNIGNGIEQIKQSFGNAQFFAGVTGGLNYTQGKKNKFQGVHIGATGELVLNEHWSIFGAVEYFNRSGNNKSIQDNYITERANAMPDSVSTNYWHFLIKTDSTNHYFNFSTVHSFELPFTVKYTFNKFFVTTGINLAYYLKLNVEEVNKTTLNANTHWVSTNFTKPILANNKPQYSSQDFSSRFGVGYLLGVGYQLAPSWQVEAKMSYLFWDNAKSIKSKSLSKDFYQIPSFQLSIGYQFGKNKEMPKYGPTDSH